MSVPRTSASASDSGVAANLPDYIGFRVDSPCGRVGVVEELRRHEGDASQLVVRAGKHGLRLLIFPVSDIVQVVPADRRITLRSRFHLTTSEALSGRAGQATSPAL